MAKIIIASLTLFFAAALLEIGGGYKVVSVKIRKSKGANKLMKATQSAGMETAPMDKLKD